MSNKTDSGADPDSSTVLDNLDPELVRNQLGLSQGDFAKLLGMGEQGYLDWEEGKRRPGGPARRLLYLFKTDPKGTAEKLGSLS